MEAAGGARRRGRERVVGLGAGGEVEGRGVGEGLAEADEGGVARAEGERRADREAAGGPGDHVVADAVGGHGGAEAGAAGVAEEGAVAGEEGDDAAADVQGRPPQAAADHVSLPRRARRGWWMLVALCMGQIYTNLLGGLGANTRPGG